MSTHDEKQSDAPDSDGWIANPGHCPVASDTPVEIQFYSGRRNAAHKASDWVWVDGGGPYDIAAYRVIDLASNEPADDGVLCGADALLSLATAWKSGNPPSVFEFQDFDGQWQKGDSFYELATLVCGPAVFSIRRKPAKPKLTIDALAQEIRRVDGNHSLGAGALAEALMPYLVAASGGQS